MEVLLASWWAFIETFTHVDPMLSTVPMAQLIELFTSFIERVWEGHYNDGTQVYKLQPIKSHSYVPPGTITISHDSDDTSAGTTAYPVPTLTHHVHAIINNSYTLGITLPAHTTPPPPSTCARLQVGNINTMIKSTAQAQPPLQLDKQEDFRVESISSNLLWTGGTMLTMHLNDIDHDKICKQGCWSSYVLYVHS
jgi:hypothetical protein